MRKWVIESQTPFWCLSFEAYLMHATRKNNWLTTGSVWYDIRRRREKKKSEYAMGRWSQMLDWPIFRFTIYAGDFGSDNFFYRPQHTYTHACTQNVANNKPLMKMLCHCECLFVSCKYHVRNFKASWIYNFINISHLTFAVNDGLPNAWLSPSLSTSTYIMRVTCAHICVVFSFFLCVPCLHFIFNWHGHRLSTFQWCQSFS